MRLDKFLKVSRIIKRRAIAKKIADQANRPVEEVIEAQSQERQIEEVIIRPVAVLDDREDHFKTKYWRDDGISIDYIPF